MGVRAAWQYVHFRCLVQLAYVSSVYIVGAFGVFGHSFKYNYGAVILMGNFNAQLNLGMNAKGNLLHDVLERCGLNSLLSA